MAILNPLIWYDGEVKPSQQYSQNEPDLLERKTNAQLVTSGTYAGLNLLFSNAHP